jgi:hypothetical protein
MSELKGWFERNSALIYFLIGQAIIAGVYVVNLEARVSVLEVRGSPHLSTVDNRLTVLESMTKTNKDSIDRVVTVMTKELHINPVKE